MSLGNRDNSEVTSYGLQVDYDLDFATFTSVTGYRDHTFSYAEDFDGLPIVLNSYGQDQSGIISSRNCAWSPTVTACSAGMRGSPTTRSISTPTSSRRWARMSGAPSTGPRRRRPARTCLTITRVTPSTTPTATTSSTSTTISAPSTGRAAPPGTCSTPTAPTGHNGYAAYLDLGYEFSERWDANLGVRYTLGRKGLFQLRIPEHEPGAGQPRSAGILHPGGGSGDSRTWDHFTPG